MFLNALVNGIIQVLVFSLIPFVWWLITARKKENFFNWIGLKRPKTDNGKVLVLWIVGGLAVAFLVGQLAVLARGELEAADSAYKGMGAVAIPSILAYSFIQTGLSEEILFRGFILKRLVAKFGLFRANIMQAAIFGVIHILMVWGHVTVFQGLLIVVYPMFAAVLLGYIDEKKGNGSIIPSWIIHGSINTLSILLQVF